MKCNICGHELHKEKSRYVCTNCGAIIAIEPKEKTAANRGMGCFILVLGVALSVTMFTQSADHILTFADIPIPFGFECLGVLFILFGLWGLLGLLGIVYVVKEK